MANLNTGDTYALGADLFGDLSVGDRLGTEFLPLLSEAPRALLDDERRALEAIQKGEAVARVEAQVAQQLKLGGRELDRRSRRRRARRS